MLFVLSQVGAARSVTKRPRKQRKWEAHTVSRTEISNTVPWNALPFPFHLFLLFLGAPPEAPALKRAAKVRLCDSVRGSVIHPGVISKLTPQRAQKRASVWTWQTLHREPDNPWISQLQLPRPRYTCLCFERKDEIQRTKSGHIKREIPRERYGFVLRMAVVCNTFQLATEVTLSQRESKRACRCWPFCGF